MATYNSSHTECVNVCQMCQNGQSLEAYHTQSSSLPVSVLLVAGLLPAAASEARLSAPSLSDMLPRPGVAPPPARPPVAAASDLTGRLDCGSSARSARAPLTTPHRQQLQSELHSTAPQ